VKQVFFVGDLAVVDVNAAFADSNRAAGDSQSPAIRSLVQTLGANFPQIERVEILVDGREREDSAGTNGLSTIVNVKDSAPH
jgi:hypothetical protein